MSIQEEEQDIIDIKDAEIKKEQDKINLFPLEINRHDYNVISYSTDSSRKYKIISRNFENDINYQQIIKTMKEIKHNFI
jgi:hypothetical protein